MAAHINEQFRDMTRCCICTETYSDPRILSCIHTFCLRCLEQIGMQSNKKPGDKLPCPFCRKEFIIPDKGMDWLQKNFFMDNLIEMIKIAKPPQKTFCNFCLEELGELDDKFEEVPVATVCCIDCHENLCDECSMHHKKQKPTRNHQIVPLGSEVVSRQVAPLKTCNQHNSEHLKIYCFDCKTVVCVMCFVESHKPHECTDIHKVADDFRQKIGQDAQQMSHLLLEGTSRVERLEEARTDVKRKVDLMEREIRARAEKLKTLIERHLQLELEDLEERKRGMLKKLELDQNETKQHLSIVESFQSYSNEVREKGSPGDVCASANDLHVRADELQQLHKSCIRVPVPAFHCSFHKMDLEDILELQNNNILGHIKDNAADVKVMDVDNKALLGNKANPQQNNGPQQRMFQPTQQQGIQFQPPNFVYQPAPQTINQPDIAFPKYWRNINRDQRQDGAKYEKVQLRPGSQLYKELVDMFTCVVDNNCNKQQYIARGLHWTQANFRPKRISKIWCIENSYLYGRYVEKKKALCLNALVNTCRPLPTLLRSEVATLKPDLALVNSTLVRKVNEYFLFYETTPETQEHISRKGFSAADAGKKDLAGFRGRRAVDEDEKKFGSTGIYFRETAGNVDDIDYVDQIWFDDRTARNGSFQYMFVARVLLGNSFLCQRPRAYKRTPCMCKGCYSDSCNHRLLSGSFDSVIGTTEGGHKYYDDGTLRNFVIYSPDQSYPDFLIEYQ